MGAQTSKSRQVNPDMNTWWVENDGYGDPSLWAPNMESENNPILVMVKWEAPLMWEWLVESLYCPKFETILSIVSKMHAIHAERAPFTDAEMQEAKNDALRTS